jgi:hypothetical protein
MRTKFCNCFGAIVLGISSLVANVATATLLYNPVVTVVGDGTTTASGNGYNTSIYLYHNSLPAQLAPISSATYNSGATGTRLVNSASASSEGSLTNNPGISDNAALGLSYAGPAYAYSAGYDAANNTASVNSAATNANRSLGDVTLAPTTVSNATVLQTQTQATAYSANNIRGATGDNGGVGQSLFSAGTGTPTTTAGWRNFVTNTQLPSGTLTNTRTVELLGGNLFGSTGSGTTGIYLLDAAGVNPATPFVATGTSSDHSPYEFALFKDTTNQNSTQGYNVAYIADDGAAGAAAGGIEKWTYNGATWTQAYILRDPNNPTTINYRGLSGEKDPTTGLFTLFASTSDGLKLQQVTDVGAASPFTTLATAPVNTVFRGVALDAVPEPSTSVLVCAALASVLATARCHRRSAK